MAIAEAVRIYGQDPGATAHPDNRSRGALPNTPPALAAKVLETWSRAAVIPVYGNIGGMGGELCAERAKDELSDGKAPPLDLMKHCSGNQTARRLYEHALEASRAFVWGQAQFKTIRTPAGDTQVLPAAETAMFWNAILKWSIEAGASGALTAEADRQYAALWSDMKANWKELAEDVGNVAGGAAAIVGGAIGKGTKGFFDGLFEDLDVWTAAGLGVVAVWVWRGGI